ncbi:hypothetical protein V6N13_004787 [Hibiscus sabdariffa]
MAHNTQKLNSTALTNLLHSVVHGSRYTHRDQNHVYHRNRDRRNHQEAPFHMYSSANSSSGVTDLEVHVNETQLLL